MEKFWEERKEWVSRFLRSYLTHLELEQVDGDDGASYPEVGEVSAPLPYDRELEAGQIRVLPGTDRVTYVALLRRWEADSFVVMPFSRFDAPATDEEFKPWFDGGMYLRVLQAWNARTLQDATLRRSWCVGSLPERDVADAWRVWRWAVDGAALPDGLLCRTGLPIYRAGDPRLDYKRRELANFARVDAEDLAEAEEEETWSIWIWKEQAPAVVTVAAGEEQGNPRAKYSVPGRGAVLYVEYSRHDRTISFDVYGEADGEVSAALDGWQVWSADQGVLYGTVEKGRLRVSYSTEADGQFVVTDENGVKMNMERIND